MGKPNGIRTARKLRNHRRDQRWHDKDYKKAHLGTRWKSNPFGGASHAKGIVLEKVGVEAKQPNSAIRKCVRVQLIKNGKHECVQMLEFHPIILLQGKRSQLSFPMMVVSTTLKKTTKSSSLDSDVKDTPSEISPELGSRWLRWPMYRCWRSTKKRKRDQGLNQDTRLVEFMISCI